MTLSAIEHKLDCVAKTTGWDRKKIAKTLEVIHNKLNNIEHLDINTIIDTLMQVSAYANDFKSYDEKNLLDRNKLRKNDAIYDFVAADKVRFLAYPIRGFFPENPEILGSIERLNRNRIYTIGDLLQYSEKELRGQFNVAATSIEKFAAKLSLYGFRLGMRFSDVQFQGQTEEVRAQHAIYEQFYQSRRARQLAKHQRRRSKKSDSKQRHASAQLPPERD